MYRIITIFIGLFIISTEISWSQCSVTITPPSATINCGESLDLTALASGTVPLLLTDFNNGTAGPGWSSGGGTTYGQPCGPGIDGTPYYWASTSAGTPQLTTVAFDVSCGGTVSFDMAYSTQGGAAPCEGPDLANEGVTFEYSTNGGATWTTIQYWNPNGGNDPMLTNWNSYSFTIPAGAVTTTTMFRWIQYNSSGTCCDNWGIDNVLISPGLCGGNWYYDWAHVPGSPDTPAQTVAPLTTTQYSVLVTDGVDICYDTVLVTVNPLLAAASATLTNLTCLQCSDLDVVLTNSNAGSIVDDFDPALETGMWSSIQNGTVGTGCGGNPGNGLHFNGPTPNRYAVTVPIDATVCGMASFCLRMGSTGSGGAPCENADAGENVAFEYSVNNGVTWTSILIYDHSLWDANPAWQCFTVPIPPPAQTTNTMFRWRQLTFSGNNNDNWSLDNVNIACAPPAYDYSWTPATGLDDANIQTPEACPVVSTTYTATITDPASGCSASDDISISVICTCTIFGETAVISQCENGNSFTVSGEFNYVESPATGSFIVEVTNASGTYTQTFPAPFSDTTLQNYSISGIIADGSPLTVDFYFTDDMACTAQLTDVSPVLPTLTSISGGAVYCPGQTVNNIEVEVTGNGPWTVDYLLDGVANTASGNTTTISLGNLEGAYELVAVNDAGCTNTAVGFDTIAIYNAPVVIDYYGGDTYCQGDPINYIELEISGNGPWTVDYTVDGTAATLTGNTLPLQLGNTPGVYVINSIEDANCSSAVNDTETIIISPAPNVFAGNDFISCENDAIVLSGSGAQSYSWDNGIQNGVSFVPLVTTTYTVTGTSSNGCEGTDQITVTVEPLPVVSFVADVMEGCEPLTVFFTNTTPGNLANCEWSFGDGSSVEACGGIQHIYEYGGLYEVALEVTSSNGCVNSATYPDYIYVENNPSAGFQASTQQVMSLDPEVVFNNTSTGAVNYVWDFGDNSTISTDENPYHTFPGDEHTGYMVTLYAYSPIGCVDSAQLLIQVKEEIIYYIPNTFTPDGDELNQNFSPVFTAGFDPFDFNMKIFNRWGEIVFESNNAEIGWDGTYGGKIAPDGIYTWKIEFKTIASDERIMLSGHLNLIR